MVLIGLAIALGFAVGRTLPSPSRHVVPFDFRAWPLLVAGVVALVLAGRLDGGAALFLHVAGLLVLALVVAANLHLTGMGVIGVGLACNLFIIGVNGGMPVRDGALVEAGLADVDELPTIDLHGVRHLERDSDVLTFLGDAAVLPLGHVVVSIGDLIVAVGLADVVANLTRGRRRSTRRSVTKAPTADGDNDDPGGGAGSDGVIDLRTYVPDEESLARALAARLPQGDRPQRRTL